MKLFEINEATLRFIIFLGLLMFLIVAEIAVPRRKLSTSKAKRWFNNLSITAFNTIVARLAVPVMPVAMAYLAGKSGWGLLNALQLPLWLKYILSLALMDMIIYFQHVMFHTVPLLWRVHLVHHSDLDIDVTTGLRFHPIEITLSMLIKLSVVSVLGPPPGAVLAFEAVLNGTSMFNHSNIRIPAAVDRLLRLIVVTPDMHRVHHSVAIRETNSNFGFSLPWWDRIFGTYRGQPAAGHEGMNIGLAQYRDTGSLSLLRLVILPFVADPGGYAINRRGREPGSGDGSV